MDSLIDNVIEQLANWAKYSEQHFFMLGDTQTGFYGTGYSRWGTQTQQKYCSALAVLGVIGKDHGYKDWQWAIDRALAALRFTLNTHLAGDGCCTDGKKWGNTWLSALGIERMMHAVYLLEPYLTDDDRQSLKAMLISESKWLYEVYCEEDGGIHAGMWADDGMNKPESNIWNGAILWRTAEMYPQVPAADDWREKAHRFFINGVSIPADENDQSVLAGKTIAQRYFGPNFFPHYGLDHHGYANVGYQVICLSNAGMLHFDTKLAGLQPPETLYHHQEDLWKIVKKFIFADGTLARIGGDSRVRYCYCQDYLLPSLLYAHDKFNDAHALELARKQLKFIGRETDHNADGSFYGKRLKAMADNSIYYYTRLESDRACVLGQFCTYAKLLKELQNQAEKDFETSVAGSWSEPEHGSAVHRSKTRFASFTFRAANFHQGLQGLCQPPDDGHLAAWAYNLSGYAIPVSGQHGKLENVFPPRKVGEYKITEFDGGFAACGQIIEGSEILIPEGWHGKDAIFHNIAFVALPDNHTVLCFQNAHACNRRTFVQEVAPMHLNIPNGLYNDFSRTLYSNAGGRILSAEILKKEFIDLGSRWANIDNRIGAVGLYGAESLTLDHSDTSCRVGIEFQYSDRLCWGHKPTFTVDAGEMVMDVGWACISNATAEQTAEFAARNPCSSQPIEDDDPIRKICITAMDGNKYMVIANLGGVAINISGQLPANVEILSPANPGGTLAPWEVYVVLMR